MIIDPISDLIVRLKNGSDAKKVLVDISYSKFVENVAHALKKAGYLVSVEKKKDAPRASGLQVGLVYDQDGNPRIHGVERVSKSSRRIYQKANDIRMYRSGFGNVFLSTPKGIMVDMEAKKNKVGGEVLFKIW